ncbi:MAG: NAD-dependent epimerase/dehydratase family protein [Pseudomonadota bacterium]
MSKFFITGGAGFIGSHVAEELLKGGWGEVVIYDDLSGGFKRNLDALKGTFKLIKGDVRKYSKLEKSMKDADYVVHLAAFVSAFDSYNKPQLTHEINIQGTNNVLEAANNCGVRRVVLASSAAIYGTEANLPNTEALLPRPESPYAISKICNEYQAFMFTKIYGLKTVALRLFNVFGPRQSDTSQYSGVISRFLSAFQNKANPEIYGDGSQTRDFISVKDVARSIILALTNDRCGLGEVMNIGTGRETNLLQILTAFDEIYGVKQTRTFKPWRDGDIKRSVANVTRAKELLGFEAQISLKDGLRLMA